MEERELLARLAAIEKANAVMEERMNTKQAEYKTDIGRLAADMKSVMEQRDTEAAKRETRLVVTFIGVVFALMAAGFTIMTFMLRTSGTVPGS